MIKRVAITFIIFVLIYAALIELQIFLTHLRPFSSGAKDKNEEATHKVYSFSFAKYSANGEKEMEIEGDSADILTQTVNLINVVAKAYAEETPVTITADQGHYNKTSSKVHLQKNVVATTENGTRLLTEALDIHAATRKMETEIETEVKKDNINVESIGAQGDSNLKKVEFKKNVTVMIQDPENKAAGPTVITCDGPLMVDYEKNIAHFKNNVVAKDQRGKLSADAMDVYYNRVTRHVSKIVALGNVAVENPDGNKTYADSVIYLPEEGRVILGGDTETVYFGGSDLDKEIF